MLAGHGAVRGRDHGGRVMEEPNKIPKVPHTNLTKDEVSDLNSHVSRVLETGVTAFSSNLAHKEAQRQLEIFIHGLQYRRGER